MLKKFFEINFLLSNVFVPVIVLAFYCASFLYFSSHFLLQGVNYYFVSRLGKYLLLIVVALILTLFVILKVKKGGRFTFENTYQKFYPGDLFLLLLPLTPVVQYILNNQELLSAKESLYVLIFFVFCAAIYIFAIPALLSTVISTQTLMILGLAFVFTIVSMASLSDYFTWFEKGRLRVQLLFFGGVFLIVWLLYNLNQRRFLYLLIVVMFVANSFAQWSSQRGKAESASLSFEQNKLLALVRGRTPPVTPNIYFLLYDAYVSNETLLAHGIDNGVQEDYLKEQGFQLYPHTYSVGSTTVATLSKVLNASPAYYGNQRRAVSGDGITQNILRSLGYKTYGVFASDYMFRGVGEKYDFSIPENTIPSDIRLLKAILIGEFRFDTDDITFEGQARNQFIETKQSIFKDASSKQVFVFMYTNVPGHSQTSGACRPNETDLFKERLASANSEMRQDLQTITGNDPNAIIIVAGDHGPYLTKNCAPTSGVYDISEISRLDIQDRYGAFLAIKWPTEDFVKYDEITVLQDLFPAVFAYLYKDPAILQSKIDPVIPIPNGISGASVNQGIIHGGINNGEALFLSGK
ncbi:MAG TPA: hypothetical protein VK206_18685 [Anaerolineales bacterium]|nr:hypothetical protein [Anaerolineales bacterium]HLO28159.1 hypothetical protein [Anaerolineales bacterium]